MVDTYCFQFFTTKKYCDEYIWTYFFMLVWGYFLQIKKPTNITRGSSKKSVIISFLPVVYENVHFHINLPTLVANIPFKISQIWRVKTISYFSCNLCSLILSDWASLYIFIYHLYSLNFYSHVFFFSWSFYPIFKTIWQNIYSSVIVPFANTYHI